MELEPLKQHTPLEAAYCYDSCSFIRLATTVSLCLPHHRLTVFAYTSCLAHCTQAHPPPCLPSSPTPLLHKMLHTNTHSPYAE